MELLKGGGSIDLIMFPVHIHSVPFLNLLNCELQIGFCAPIFIVIKFRGTFWVSFFVPPSLAPHYKMHPTKLATLRGWLN